MLVKNRVEVKDIQKLTPAEVSNIITSKARKGSPIVDTLYNVKIAPFLQSSKTFNGFYLQHFQRGLSVNKHSISELFSMFYEISNQISMGVYSYTHTVNVLCINQNAIVKDKKVISVFDGQHRLIFFCMVLFSIMLDCKKMNKGSKIYKATKKMAKEIRKILFKSTKIDSESFLIKYVDTHSKEDLELFLGFVNGKVKEADLAKNDFYLYFNEVRKNTKKFVSSFEYEVDGLVNLYNYVVDSTSFIVRKLLPDENEMVVYLNVNRALSPFFEYEVVKMITTGMISNEEEKIAYAQNYNNLINFVKKESNLKEKDISHILRFTILSITKDTSFHISVTNKSKEENKLSGVVKNSKEFKDFFKSIESDTVGYEKFLELFNQYIVAYVALSSGNFKDSLEKYGAKASNIEFISSILKTYSFVFNTMSSLNERFSYLVIEQTRRLIFNPEEINLRAKRGEKNIHKNKILSQYFLPVERFLELFFVHFVVRGTGEIKQYESAFDKVFVGLVEQTDFDFDLLFSKHIIKFLDSNYKSDKVSEMVDRQLSVFNNRLSFDYQTIESIHSNKGIQTGILFLIEFFSIKAENPNDYYFQFFDQVVSSIVLNYTEGEKVYTSNLTIEHVIPGSINDPRLLKYSNFWFLINLLEIGLNKEAGNKALSEKNEIYEDSSFSTLDRFSEYDSYEELVDNADSIKEKTLSLVSSQIFSTLIL